MPDEGGPLMPSKILEAVYHGRGDELAALLAGGATLTLCEAAAVGDARRVRALLDADRGRVRERSDDGWTALHLAAHFGRLDVVTLLLARGADPLARSQNDMANQPIHAAAAGRAAAPVVAQLLARGAQVNATQSGGFTALHEAAFKNDRALADLLLAHGADVAARTNDGETAEAIATRLGHAQLARRLRGELP
jgi:ankyrin repeat protein